MIIGLGSVVKAKVVDMEDNIREGKIRRMWKEVAGCIQAVLGNKKLLFQFEDGHQR